MTTKTDITLPPLPEWSKMDDLGGLVPSEVRVALAGYARSAVEANRPADGQIVEDVLIYGIGASIDGKRIAPQDLYMPDRQGREEPAVWKPIEVAPKDNKRLLYLARLDDQGKLVELDFDGVWEYWQESWELSHINGYCWMSANGIEEPTHWAYQDEPPPTTPQPAASAEPDWAPNWNAMLAAARNAGWSFTKSEDGIVRMVPLVHGEAQVASASAAPIAQEPVAWFTEDHLTDKSATTWDATVAERWRAKGWPVDPLYAVSVAQEPPQVTDAEIEQIVTGAGARWDGSVWKIEDADLHPLVRALLYRYTTAPVAAQAQPSGNAGELSDEREAFVAWLSGEFPRAWPAWMAERAWDNNHVAAMAWRVAQSTAQAVRDAALEEAAVQCEDIYSWPGAIAAGVMYRGTQAACAAAIRALKTLKNAPQQLDLDFRGNP